MLRTLLLRPPSPHQAFSQYALIFPFPLKCTPSPCKVSKPPSRSIASGRNVLPILASRGLLQDVWPQGDVSSHQLAAILEKESCGVYAGFDPTASSLHVGNLLILVGLIHFQRAGHRAVALLGGATARIGDPSGRNSERQEVSEEEVQANLKGIQNNIERVFANYSENLAPKKTLPKLEIVNNEDWYRKMNVMTFMGKVGRRLRISRMLGRHSVKSRLESTEGLSFTEFTYQALQAHDWAHLHATKRCLVQLGGSDQLGNMVAGQEVLQGEQCWGVLLPLITDEAGNKFGKSAGAPVWLDQSKTSVFEFYQFFVRVPDALVGSLLRQFTFLPDQEVAALEEKHREKPELRLGQTALAQQVTLLVHGEEGLRIAERTTSVLYKQDLKTLSQLNVDEARQIFHGAPYLRRLFKTGITILDLATMIGCFKHERDAMRIIGAGGFYINTIRITNIEEVVIHGKHIMANNMTVVRVGKKNHYIVEWT